MSDSASLRLLDFHSPRRPSSATGRQLSQWMTGTCTQVQEGWATLLARPVTLKFQGTEAMQHRDALKLLPEDGLGLYFTVSDSLLPAMLVFSARQVQALIADLLDMPGEDWPVPKAVTSVEEAMLELLFQKLAEGMSEAWPDSKPLRCRFLETTIKPHRTRLFPMGAPLLVTTVQFKSRFGEENAWWLMLKEETEALISDQLGDAPPEDRGVRPSLATLAERVPMTVVVELGTVDISMSQAANLNVGDVLVLDQFLNRALVARLEGQPKWTGMPRRIGSRQAFEIAEQIDDSRI